jgi:serine/threonine protein kinase/tetratricopeptide (TPR) repeat protein
MMEQLTETQGRSRSTDGSLAELVEALTAQLQSGAPVDWSAAARDHPDHADDLRALAPALTALGDLSRGVRPNGEIALGTLGDFRILREVGRGGMSVVYEAEQMSLGRRVALKVLPFAATMDQRHLQRFHNEARAAASLHHEHIGPVHAVGCERGVHFIAMQFIDGVTLAQAIRAVHRLAGPGLGDPTVEYVHGDSPLPEEPTITIAGLTTESGQAGERFFRTAAELMVQAAEALEYAHSLGIVHRDVKPGNLMVDTAGKLWVTDFGLAKHGDASLTMSGDLLGTLRYMSPEQALARHGLVDHRTDVYSLGATLYELLTGRPAVVGNDHQEILKQIAFDEPIAPRKLNNKLPRDLETVVCKCLEKNPDHRYPTAKELAEDLRLYLSERPIRAKPATLAQRARKWSQRHPAVVRSAVILLVLVTAGSSLSTWLIWQARTRMGHALAAETAQRTRANEESQIARDRDEETTAVLEFVESKIFAAARPEGQEGGLGHDVKLREALEAALPFVETRFKDKPLIEARLRRTIGVSFRQLGKENVAVQQFEVARALYEKYRGPTHRDTLTTMMNLANSYHELHMRREALDLREKTLGLQRATLGDDDDATLKSMNNLANSYDAFRRYQEALKLREEALERTKAKHDGDPGHTDTLRCMNNLAISYTRTGRPEDAVRLLEEILELLQAKPEPDCTRVLAAMTNLADSYHALGRHSEGLQLYEEAFALANDKLLPDHPKRLLIVNNLAWFLATAEDVQFRDKVKAVALAEKAAAVPPKNADFWGTLGAARYRNGEWEQAARDLDNAIKLHSPNPAINESFFLAMARWQLGDKAGAKAWFDKGVAAMNKAKTQDDEMRRFRTEAAELLGIKDEVKRSGPATPK